MKFQSFCKRLFLVGFILTILCSMPAIFQQMIIPTLYSNQIYVDSRSSQQSVFGRSTHSLKLKSSSNGNVNIFNSSVQRRAGFYGVKKSGKACVVVYNAVPKTGSRSLFTAIKTTVELSRSLPLIRTDKITRNVSSSEESFNTFVRNTRSPAFLRGHVPFLHLPSRFLYINMVRDPLKRFVSEYYFMRNGDNLIPARSSQLSHGYKPNQLPEGWNDTLDKCVRKGSSLCSPGSGMMRMFCGFSPNCSFASRWTLKQAKNHLKRYTVVGLTDEFEATLQVLERLFPDMLKDATKNYRETGIGSDKYQTINRHEPLESTKKILKEQMSLEYEFYNFVLDKFHRLKKKLGVS